MKVAICEYGAGNVRSVEIALRRLGAELTDRVEEADLAVLPGVGLGARRDGRSRRARPRRRPAGAFAAGRPILGICLGLQLALAETEEDGGVTGLGLLPGRSLRLCEGRVPRIGWAEVDGRGTFYFAHSYAAETPCATAWSEGIVAEARSGSFFGCQFHPEKSGELGARYLEEALSLSLA